MFGLFSERNKEEDDEIFKYNEIPEKLRNQLIYILEDDILEGEYDSYAFIHRMLCREYGLKNLNKKAVKNEKINLIKFIEEEEDIEKIFDLIEFSLRYKKHSLNNAYLHPDDKKEILDSIINEINIRFKESSIGYEIVNGEFKRIDSEYTFSEIIKPCINLTSNKKFKNVNEEYLDAFDEYKKGDNKDCLVKCLKSLESTLKIIFSEKGWEYEEKDRFKKLLDIGYENELIPKEMQSTFGGLRSILESSVSPIRNKYGGHGQGKDKIKVKDYLARYVLNVTATCIIFLIEVSNI